MLSRPPVFSRVLGCGARRGPACTPRCKCGSRPSSVARALGVQSSEIWQVTTGSLSGQLAPTKPVQTPKMACFVFSFFTSFAAVFDMKKHSNQQRLGSHGTTAALQAFPFVTATNGASACGFVSVRVFARVSSSAALSEGIIRRQRKILQQKEPGTQSQQHRCHSAFIAHVYFCYAVRCGCVPVSHRKLFTLWQPRNNSTSGT